MKMVLVGEASPFPDTTADRAAAFDAIVQQYQARIARYLVRLVDDPELALDLTQDTFVSAFRNIHALRSELALGAWLYRIATNMAIHARKKNRRILWQRLADYENSSAASVVAPDEVVMSREQVRQALMKLPRDRAACLMLHINEGFTYAEVAAILGITPEAARKRIGRAKGQFRAFYDAAERSVNPNRSPIPGTLRTRESV
jgi:RNA polymerase sigma-70 factor, ECF subfamily